MGITKLEGSGAQRKSQSLCVCWSRTLRTRSPFLPPRLGYRAGLKSSYRGHSPPDMMTLIQLCNPVVEAGKDCEFAEFWTSTRRATDSLNHHLQVDFLLTLRSRFISCLSLSEGGTRLDRLLSKSDLTSRKVFNDSTISKSEYMAKCYNNRKLVYDTFMILM